MGRHVWQCPGEMWAQLGILAASALGTTSHSPADQLGTWDSGSPGGVGEDLCRIQPEL